MTTPCRTEPVDYWFSTDPTEQLVAIQLCNTCVLKPECQKNAPREVHGVWGGILVGRTRQPQPNTGRPDLELRTYTCAAPDCDEEFESRSTKARWCSDRCRQRTASRVRRARKDDDSNGGDKGQALVA